MSRVKNDAFYGEAYVISECYTDIIIGKQMEIIEALGLPEKQETSVKELLKKVVWETHHNESLRIQNDLNSAIREAKRKILFEMDRDKNWVPFEGVSLKDLV